MIVIMPMAGRGSRYVNKGYTTPKPLIEVAGKPMFVWALESLKDIEVSLLIIVSLEEHEKDYQLNEKIATVWHNKFQLILLKSVTEGQLCTVMAAKDYLNTNEDLLILSSDTFVESNIGEEILKTKKNVDGIISVFNLSGDQWSFAKVDNFGNVIEVAEKSRISDYASTGLYYFTKASEFLQISKEIINANVKTKGEFYIMPVYNYLIGKNKKVRISIANQMWDMGTPESKSLFESKYNNE